MITAQLVGQIALAVLAGLVISIILAEIRNPFAIGFINLACALAAAVFIIVVEGLQYLVPKLRQFTHWLQESISEGRASFSMTDIIGPLVYFVCLILLTTGDAYLAILTIPQIFGANPPTLNPDLFAPATAVLWVTIFVSIFAAMLDLLGVSHFLRTYGKPRGKVLLGMQIAAVVAFGLVIITAVLFGYFRKELNSPVTQQLGSGGIDSLLTIMFFVVIVLATLAASPALFEGMAPFLLVLASLLNFIAHVLAFILSIPIEILDRVAGLIVGLYDALASIGRAFWNYLSQITRGSKGAIPRIADPKDRGHIGEVIRLPAL